MFMRRSWPKRVCGFYFSAVKPSTFNLVAGLHCPCMWLELLRIILIRSKGLHSFSGPFFSESVTELGIAYYPKLLKQQGLVTESLPNSQKLSLLHGGVAMFHCQERRLQLTQYTGRNEKSWDFGKMISPGLSNSIGRQLVVDFGNSPPVAFNIE